MIPVHLIYLIPLRDSHQRATDYWLLATGHWPLRPSAQSLDLRPPTAPVANSQSANSPNSPNETKVAEGQSIYYAVHCIIPSAGGQIIQPPSALFATSQLLKCMEKSPTRRRWPMQNRSYRLHSIQIMTVNG